MYALICLALAVAAVNAEPGIFGEASFGDFHGGPIFDAHAAPALPAPVFAAPILKTPVFAAPTFLKTPVFAPAPAPVFAHAPILAPAPVFKAIAPIIKQVAPASSYATVTQFHVTHPATVVKAVVAPQPIVKTLALPAISALPAPFSFGHGHGFH